VGVPVEQSDVMAPPLILASTSPYRHELLSRLRLPFEALPPGVDELALPAEAPPALAARLASAKAAAVARRRPEAVVIGSDQVCELDGEALGKPGSLDRAAEQLRRLSGRSAVFHTALSVQHAAVGFARDAMATVRVRFRRLGDAEIGRYLALEPALDCAGSAKSEALGIALLEAIESDDPTALVGLPLIRTTALLREAGLDPLAS
jgi:septum formation protein